MYIENYEIQKENVFRIYFLGNGLYDDMNYSGYQKRGDGHGIEKNYRKGNGDTLKTNYDKNLIFIL